MTRQRLSIQLILLCLITLCVPSWSQIMGIDYGSNTIKVTTAGPGKPIDIVLDEVASRSHPSLVVLDDDTRYYGSSGSNLVKKRPLRSFLQHQRLLGKGHDSAMIDELRSNFIFNEIVGDEARNTVRFVNPYFDPTHSSSGKTDSEGNILNIIAAEPSISVEEIATMKLKHIKKITETETEAKDLKDCVITVPEFWSYKERQSLLDASQMAGLNVLGLINENTAAALKYAENRVFQENKTDVVVFYNMGSTSTKVSVIKYYHRNPTKFNPHNGAIEVLAQSWDETLGAINFDRIIAEVLMKRAFISLAKRRHTSAAFMNKLRVDPKFTARIMEAAGRAKKILSANTETQVSVEGIYEDDDFRTTITRKELYAKCGDVFERAMKPLESAVTSSGYDRQDIESIVLVGGGTRIPKIRELLTSFLGKPLKEDLNADEAPAFGAAILAAHLSPTKSTPIVEMKDITPFDVGVQIKGLHRWNRLFEKRHTLFTEKAHLSSKRTITINHISNLKVTLFYEDSAVLPLDTSRDLGYYEISITPLHEALRKYHGDDATLGDEVSVTFELDGNGMSQLVEATVKFIDGNDRIQRVNLDIKRFPSSDVMAMDSIDFLSSEKLLDALDERDSKVEDTAAARNDLESFIFESRNRLHEDERVKKVSLEGEREEFEIMLSETEDWIWDQEERMDPQIYRSKMRELEEIGNLIFPRVDEEEKREILKEL